MVAAVVVALVVVASAPSRAATAPAVWYAYADGTATGDCTTAQSSPSEQCSLGTVLANAPSGTTLYLGTASSSGTYVGNWRVTQSVTIEPAPGIAGATLDGNDGTLDSPCTTQSCAGAILTVSGAAVVNLTDVVIQHGSNTTSDPFGGFGNGGGIENDGGTIDITDATFTQDSAERGGAIYNGSSGTVNVTGSTFADNTAVLNGGAIDTADNGFGAVSVTGSTFTANRAQLDGGAVDNGDQEGSSGTLMITDSNFGDSSTPGNSARDGGAIDNADNSGSGWVDASGAIFTQNSATQDGGAIDNGDNGDGVGSGATTVTGSTFAGNSTANDGGAIDTGDHFGFGAISVSVSTFAANVANDAGGAVAADELGGGPVTVTRSTFSGDTAGPETAPNGPEIAEGRFGELGVAADVFNGGCSHAGSLDDAGYNVGIDATCFASDVNSDESGLGGGAESLAYNGGPIQTIALAAGSPGIGVIPPSTAVVVNGSLIILCPSSDERGVSTSPDGECDAGALQTPTVTVTGPSATITYGDAQPTLSPTYTGFVLGQSQSSLGAPASCRLIGAVTSDGGHVGAGVYPIACSGALNLTSAAATAGSPNTDYVFSYVDGVLTVNRAPQTIQFGPSPADPIVGESYDVRATGGGSGNQVVLSVDPSTTQSACSLGPDGMTVRLEHPGSCVIDANQTGNSDYAAAPQQQQHVTVLPAPQQIMFSAPPSPAVVGGSFVVAATGGESGNPIVFSIGSGSADSQCSLGSDGRTVSFGHAGTCVIDASQAGNNDYLAASASESLVISGSNPPAIPIGRASSGRVYWADFRTGAIRVEGRDGSAYTLFGGESNPIGVAIYRGKIYWTDSSSGTIRVGNLDGLGSPRTAFSGQSAPAGVAIDPEHGKIYWTDYDTNWNVRTDGSIWVGTLQRSGLPVPGSARRLFAGEPQPLGIAVDPGRSKLYWTDSSAGTVRVGDLEGSSPARTVLSGQGKPTALAIDPAIRRIYWTDNGTGQIMVAPLNASGSGMDGRPGTLFSREDSDPFGVAIDPAHRTIYWTDYNHNRTNHNPGAIRTGLLNASLSSAVSAAATVFSRESGPAFLAVTSSSEQ